MDHVLARLALLRRRREKLGRVLSNSKMFVDQGVTESWQVFSTA